MDTQNKPNPDVQQSPPAKCECPICQETINDAKTTNCQHTFCVSCLDKWLLTNHTCPLCRAQIREPAPYTQAPYGLTFNHPIGEMVTAAANYNVYNVFRVMSGMGSLTYSN